MVEPAPKLTSLCFQMNFAYWTMLNSNRWQPLWQFACPMLLKCSCEFCRYENWPVPEIHRTFYIKSNKTSENRIQNENNIIIIDGCSMILTMKLLRFISFSLLKNWNRSSVSFSRRC